MYHADSHGARPQPSIICGLNLARRCALPPYPRPSSPRPDAAGACCVSCPLGAGAGALSARSVSPLRRRICDSSPDGAAGDGAAGATGLRANYRLRPAVGRPSAFAKAGLLQIVSKKLPPSAFAKAAFANSLQGLRLAHKRYKAGAGFAPPAASAVRCGATGLRGCSLSQRPLQSAPRCA